MTHTSVQAATQQQVGASTHNTNNQQAWALSANKQLQAQHSQQQQQPTVLLSKMQCCW